jgi:hypothetical protein
MMKSNSGCFKKGERASQKTEFKPGQEPWNKGLKGIHMSPETEFKKGVNVLDEHTTWKGGIRLPASDCVILATGVNKNARRPRVVLELRQGRKIPKNKVVYHLDGNRYNDDPENLAIISRAELLKINQKKGIDREASEMTRKEEMTIRAKNNKKQRLVHRKR